MCRAAACIARCSPRAIRDRGAGSIIPPPAEICRKLSRVREPLGEPNFRFSRDGPYNNAREVFTDQIVVGAVLVDADRGSRSGQHIAGTMTVSTVRARTCRSSGSRCAGCCAERPRTDRHDHRAAKQPRAGQAARVQSRWRQLHRQTLRRRGAARTPFARRAPPREAGPLDQLTLGRVTIDFRAPACAAGSRSYALEVP